MAKARPPTSSTATSGARCWRCLGRLTAHATRSSRRSSHGSNAAGATSSSPSSRRISDGSAIVIWVAAPPCQDFSVICLFLAAPLGLHLRERRHGAGADQVSQHLGVPPIFVCASDFGWITRPRLWWLSIPWATFATAFPRVGLSRRSAGLEVRRAGSRRRPVPAPSQSRRYTPFPPRA